MESADLAQHGLTLHDVALYAQTLPSPSDSGGATPTPHRHDHKGQVHHAGEVNGDPTVGIHSADVHYTAAVHVGEAKEEDTVTMPRRSKTGHAYMQRANEPGRTATSNGFVGEPCSATIVGRRIANIDGVTHTHTITTVYYDGG